MTERGNPLESLFHLIILFLRRFPGLRRRALSLTVLPLSQRSLFRPRGGYGEVWSAHTNYPLKNQTTSCHTQTTLGTVNRLCHTKGWVPQWNDRYEELKPFTWFLFYPKTILIRKGSEFFASKFLSLDLNECETWSLFDKFLTLFIFFRKFFSPGTITEVLKDCVEVKTPFAIFEGLLWWGTWFEFTFSLSLSKLSRRRRCVKRMKWK